MLINDRQIIISAANSRKATYWPTQTIYWSELVEKLHTPTRGTESIAEYLKLPKSKQDELKDVGGFVAGTLENNRRKANSVMGRDVITLDLDNIPPGGTKDTLLRIDGLGCSTAVYSTRKHEESKPRLRVLIPTNRTVTADEYEPLARKIASFIGIGLCDPTTFEASRLMYWPSCCIDSIYVFQYWDKPFIDVDGVLKMYTDWRNISEWSEVPGAQASHVRLAAKQGNPTEKPGVVGAFCRTYDVYRAIDTFLPGIYETCDIEDRFTFVGGSTVGGAIIYENGNFLYSHHATDPAGGKLCNAFDLVRLHKFNELDDESLPNTPVSSLPSYKAMCELATSDTQVAALINQERYEKATQDFSTPADDTANWISKLAISSGTGLPLKTTNNILIILENDPLIKDKIAFDEFANRGLALGALPWDRREIRRTWTDNDDRGIRWYLENTYGLASPGKTDDALGLCAYKHSFNDVKDYITGLTWDGVKRVDTLLIDYLGAMDNVYTRAVIRKFLVAAVARAMTPGCKFDYMPILGGPQGIGKSTFLKILGRSWYSESLSSFEGKEAAELIQGRWINEIGELTGLNKSEVNTIKQFLSKTEDIYREPYGRRTAAYPRRCVFAGTTNDTEYLKDKTGNRRFWPVDLGIQQPIKSVWEQLPEEVNQIWAEAFLYWQLGEKLYLTDGAAEEAVKQQEDHQESNVKEGLIHEFVERPIPIDWHKCSLNERRMYWLGEFQNDNSNTQTMQRDRVCAAEIWCECFGGDLRYMKRIEAMEINAILGGLKGWKRHNSSSRYGPYGTQKGFIRHDEILSTL
ncbi:virulence-associated protein E [Clostridium sp. 19966]|uniref:virulence-associated E family protein n=1 Tax=Clostridium sp. 19966 TaxID=2768166 RepID=UPI0028E06F9E|nr:virulence-associated E family protein [Clostridium sp. 19966]MDT8715459.1 virulence-associated protein E [Clostridium sp. 19966]